MKRPLFLLLLISLIISCKKSQTVKPVTPVQTNQKLLVASETGFDTNGNQTSQYLYTYDANNRVILDIATLPYPGRDTMRYSYDNNGNLTALNYELNFTSTIYSYINDVPTATYDVSSPLDTVYHYIITNNKVTNIFYGNQLVYNIKYNGNNFESITFSLYTYGTKKSPFYISGLKWFLASNTAFVTLTEFGANFPFVIQSQNEIIGETITQGGVTNSYTYKYTYNSSGYPIKGTVYTSGVLTGTVVFTYITAK
jgi:hypothetical protein